MQYIWARMLFSCFKGVNPDQMLPRAVNLVETRKYFFLLCVSHLNPRSPNCLELKSPASCFGGSSEEEKQSWSNQVNIQADSHRKQLAGRWNQIRTQPHPQRSSQALNFGFVKLSASPHLEDCLQTNSIQLIDCSFTNSCRLACREAHRGPISQHKNQLMQLHFYDPYQRPVWGVREFVHHTSYQIQAI